MKIKLYSADWCAYCQKVKNVLQTKNLEFTLIDIDRDVDAKPWIKEQGLRTIPIAVIDGEIFSSSDSIIKKIHEI